MQKKSFTVIILLFCLFSQNFIVFASENKYPDYAFEYLGEDRFEAYNRKMFNFNLG